MDFKLKVQTTCEKLANLIDSMNYPDDSPRVFATIKVLCDCIENQVKYEEKWKGYAIEECMRKFLRSCAIMSGLLEVTDTSLKKTKDDAHEKLKAILMAYLNQTREEKVD